MSWTRTLTLASWVVAALVAVSDPCAADPFYVDAWQEGQAYGFAVVDPSADEPIQVQILDSPGNPWEGFSASSIVLVKADEDFGCSSDPLFNGARWIATEDTNELGMTTIEPHGSGCGEWIVVVEGQVVIPLAMRTPDFSRDGQVDLADFVTFQSYFLQGELCADFDSDGDVDLADHVLFTGYYLNSCN